MEGERERELTGGPAILRTWVHFPEGRSQTRTVLSMEELMSHLKIDLTKARMSKDK